MEGDFYPDILSRFDIKTIIPEEPDRSYIHDRIYDELVMDIFSEKTKNGFLEVIENMNERGAQGVVLGCTEIPLLLSSDQIPVPSFSTTMLHCKAAVERAISC